MTNAERFAALNLPPPPAAAAMPMTSGLLPMGGAPGLANSMRGTDAERGLRGSTGPTGPQGPKGSFVSTRAGIYELACMEMTRPFFAHIGPKGEPLPEKFLAAITGPVFRFASSDGRHELCFGVRAEFPTWFMPDADEAQRVHSVKFWNQEYLNAQPATAPEVKQTPAQMQAQEIWKAQALPCGCHPADHFDVNCPCDAA